MRYRLSIFSMFVLFSLLLPTFRIANAQDGLPESPLKDMPWVRLGGPPGGVGYDIRMDPNNPDIMFVTDAMAGIHKSEDRGRTWFTSNTGIDLRSGRTGDLIPVFSATIDPNNSDIVWIGMLDLGGVFYSEDSGETWERRMSGIVEPYQLAVRGIAIQPGNSDVVYIGAEVGNEIWGGDYVGMVMGVIYKSTDRGLNWRPVWRGNNLVRYILIDPTDTNVMYASTGIFDRDAANSNRDTGELGGVGILKSTDAGESWVPSSNGLNNLYINSIDFHPENPQIILAGSRHANWPHDEGAGLYITYNGGEEWNYLIGTDVTAVEFSDTFPDYAYAIGQAEFFRSFDGGSTWEMAISPESDTWGVPTMVSGFAMDIQIDPDDPLKLFVNSYQGGNFYTEDGGDTWITASVGYTGSTFYEIAAHPDNPGLVYATGRTGPFVSRDGGVNWVPISIVKHYTEGSAIAVDPNDPLRILSADLNSGCIGESPDWGTSWTFRICHEEELTELYEQGMDGRYVSQGASTIVFSPSNPMKVYAGFSVATCLESFIDGCEEFSVSSILLSEDGGTNWSALEDPVFVGTSVLEIVVHPDDANVVWAAMAGSGIAKTEDGGKSWANLSSDIDNKLLTTLALDMSNPDRLYAGVMEQGVYGSEDGGITWSPIARGMNPNEVIRAIVVDPLRPNVLYAGAEGSGVYVSEDYGKNWILMNDGLSNRSVLDLGISSDGLTLFAVTNGGGAFRLSTLSQEELSALGDALPVPEATSPDSEPIVVIPADKIAFGITIDGNGKDWENRIVISEDPSGDAEAAYPDLTSGYGFIDQGVIYFYIQIANPGADYAQYDIMLRDGTKQIMCNVPRDSDEGYCVDLTEGFFELGQAFNSSFAHGEGFEGIINIRDLVDVDELYIADINVMVGGESGEGEWRAAEIWSSLPPLPSQEESLIALPEPVEELPAPEPAEELPAPEPAEELPAPVPGEASEEASTASTPSLLLYLIGAGVLLLGTTGWIVLSKKKRASG